MIDAEQTRTETNEEAVARMGGVADKGSFVGELITQEAHGGDATQSEPIIRGTS